MGKTNPDETIVSDLTIDTKSITSTSLSSSSSRGSHRGKKKWGGNHSVPSNVAINQLKGATDELKGKVFIKGPTQAAKYDEAYKALVIYFGLN